MHVGGVHSTTSDFTGELHLKLFCLKNHLARLLDNSELCFFVSLCSEEWSAVKCIASRVCVCVRAQDVSRSDIVVL